MVKSDFTYANTGRDSGGILCRILFMEFHKQRGFSEICRLSFCHLYYTGCSAVCKENDQDVCVRERGKGLSLYYLRSYPWRLCTYRSRLVQIRAKDRIILLTEC